MELYWPTNKWWAATLTAVATVFTSWLVSPDQNWTRVHTALLIGILVQRAVAWLVPNKEDEEKGAEYEAPVPDIMPAPTVDSLEEVALHGPAKA
jgi:hypothetical protein